MAKRRLHRSDPHCKSWRSVASPAPLRIASHGEASPPLKRSALQVMAKRRLHRSDPHCKARQSVASTEAIHIASSLRSVAFTEVIHIASSLRSVAFTEVIRIASSWQSVASTEAIHIASSLRSGNAAEAIQFLVYPGYRAHAAEHQPRVNAAEEVVRHHAPGAGELFELMNSEWLQNVEETEQSEAEREQPRVRVQSIRGDEGERHELTAHLVDDDPARIIRRRVPERLCDERNRGEEHENGKEREAPGETHRRKRNGDDRRGEAPCGSRSLGAHPGTEESRNHQRYFVRSSEYFAHRLLIPEREFLVFRNVELFLEFVPAEETVLPVVATVQAARHAGRDLVRNRVVEFRERFHGNRVVRFSVHDVHRFADLNVGNLAHVDRRRVHADAPEDGAELVSDEHEARVVFAAQITVAVTDRDRRDLGGLLRYPVLTVRNAFAHGDFVNRADGRLDLHHRLERPLARTGAHRIVTVKDEARAHHVEMALRVEQRARGTGAVADLRTQTVAFEHVQEVRVA